VLYRERFPYFAQVARAIVGDRDRAMEVVQEAFVQIWEKASVYDAARGKPLTWAMTLTRNKAIDHLRRVQRRRRLQDEVSEEAKIWDHIVENDSSDEAAAHERKEIVRSAVIELSLDQRRAIEMAFFGGMTQQEIAQKLDEPLGTVKARIRRGLLKLRQNLGSRL